MQFLKVVFTLIAVGGPGYALFKFSHDAPPWVKVLSLVLGIATLIGTIIVLPQALDALEQTASRVAGYITPSDEELRRRAETEARRKVDEELRRRAAEEAVRRQTESVQRQVEEETRKANEAAAARRDAEARLKAEQDRRRAADEARLRGEMEARLRAEEDTRRRVEAEARARQQYRQPQSSSTIHQGGVIPCSADDASFIPGRGWVSNCGR